MNRTTRTLLCLALTLTLSLGTGIALAQDATPVPVLDVEWNLSKLAGEDVSDAGITATFHSEGTIVSGFGGCNTYTAGWSSDGVALEIEQILATLKLCQPEVSDRERTYFKTLQAATGWTLDGSVVTITSADGSTLVFGGDAAESPIAGSWSLTSIDGDRVPAGITATAVFGPDHALSGKGGCNDFRGQYTTDGTSLSISDLLASLMFCPDASEFESRYLSALGQASGWSVDGGSLTITGAAELVYQGGDASGTSFAGQDWLLVAQDGVEVDPTLGISAAFFEDGTVSGFGGCNQYHSTWSADGATVAIGDIGSTHMFCEPPANAAEAAFLAAMPTASTFELSGTDLTITTTSGGSLDFQPSGNRSAPVPSPVTTPAATPVGTPVPSPVTTPAATPVGTPVPSPVTTPAATPVGTPVPSPVTTPAATPVGTPVPSPVTTPAATPVGTPVPSPVTTPAATPVGTPVPSPVTTPAATPRSARRRCPALSRRPRRPPSAPRCRLRAAPSGHRLCQAPEARQR